MKNDLKWYTNIRSTYANCYAVRAEHPLKGIYYHLLYYYKHVRGCDVKEYNIIDIEQNRLTRHCHAKLLRDDSHFGQFFLGMLSF